VVEGGGATVVAGGAVVVPSRCVRVVAAVPEPVVVTPVVVPVVEGRPYAPLY
jgi:hypothetical protein